MTIRQARKAIAKAFRDDPDLRRGYVDNAACVLHDNKSLLTNRANRNRVADKLISWLFELRLT